MPENTSMLNPFDTLGRLRNLLESRYGVLDEEVSELLTTLQDDKDLDQSKIETLEEMNQEANERVIDERAKGKAIERKLLRANMEISQLKAEMADQRNQIAHLEEVIEAYKRAPVKVEAGGTFTQNYDSNVLLGAASGCDFKAGKEAVG